MSSNTAKHMTWHRLNDTVDGLFDAPYSFWLDGLQLATENVYEVEVHVFIHGHTQSY
jgi:hypothetical protein